MLVLAFQLCWALLMTPLHSFPLRLLQTRFLEYSIGPFRLRLHYPALVASMPPSWLRLGMSVFFY